MSITSTIEALPSQIAQAIADGEQRSFVPLGGRTKRGLAHTHDAADSRPVTEVDLTGHAGIVAYEPSEFLITARAGTTVAQLQSELAGSGQFLPCDPLFIEVGATLGGTVASGLSGSSRLLYGTLRDFVMEVQFIDGTGQIVRGGGKVVKNAAGFDLPKLMVGSYGRLGIITELTFKVYPAPTGAITLLFSFNKLDAAVDALQRLTALPLPLAAIDICPNPESHWLLAVRFCAPIESLTAVAARASGVVGKNACNGVSCLGPVAFDPLRTNSDEDTSWWLQQAAFIEHDRAGWLVRVATGPAMLAPLEAVRLAAIAKTSANIDMRYTGAGSVGWLRGETYEQLVEIDRGLKHLQLAGVIVSVDSNAGNALGGNSSQAAGFPQAIGDTSWKLFANRIQRALDPHQRFLNY